MIKVLHISTAKTWRGAENIIAQLYQSNTSTFSNYLFCPNDAALAKKVNHKNLFTYTKRMGYDLFAGKKLHQIIKKEKINLLHIHDSHGLNLLQIINFLGNKTKVVVHRHVNFEINNPKKYQLKNIKAIITVNKNSFEKFKRINSNTFLIYNGINTSVYNNQAKIKNSFVFVANLSEEKNPLAFVNIITILYEKDTSINAHIFGDGDLKSTVLKAIANKQFITYHGFVDDVLDKISAYEYFISTSSKEGFPLTILEAMANKLLVIAPNIDGINDILNKTNAIIYNNEHEAVQKINTILIDEKKKASLIESAFETVQQYSIQNMIQNIHQLYKKIL